MTDGEINESLFRSFFDLLDFSTIGAGILNFFIHHQSFSNLEIPPETPQGSLEKLFTATG